MPSTEFLLDYARSQVRVARQSHPNDSFEALLRDHPLYTFHPSCGAGWVSLLRGLAMHLAEHGLPDGFALSDVKEKYGELRCSAYATTDDIEAIFEAYEQVSREVCDVCGEPGRPRGKGWITTRCDVHARPESPDAVPF